MTQTIGLEQRHLPDVEVARRVSAGAGGEPGAFDHELLEANMSLGKLTIAPMTGTEKFHNGPLVLDPTVLDFWRWAASDLVSNALRGRLAEFLVAHALGATGHTRNEWDSYDLALPSGTRIEVKSAAYFQTWAQKAKSPIIFGIAPTVAWDPHTNTFAPEEQRRHQADAYVFALLAHQDKLTLNPLDVAQWEFYLLRTATLDAKCPRQKRIGLASLLRLNPTRCSFSNLSERFEELKIAHRPTEGS